MQNYKYINFTHVQLHVHVYMCNSAHRIHVHVYNYKNYMYMDLKLHVHFKQLKIFGHYTVKIVFEYFLCIPKNPRTNIDV